MGFLGYLGISSAIVPEHQSASSLPLDAIPKLFFFRGFSSRENPSLIIIQSSSSTNHPHSSINGRSMTIARLFPTQIIIAF